MDNTTETLLHEAFSKLFEAQNATLKLVEHLSGREKDVLLSVEDVAKIYEVSNATVTRMCRNGSIPAMKIGRSWRISKLQLFETTTKNF